MSERIDAWLASAIADAEQRGLPELKPLLEGLARSTTALRAADHVRRATATDNTARPATDNTTKLATDNTSRLATDNTPKRATDNTENTDRQTGGRG